MEMVVLRRIGKSSATPADGALLVAAKSGGQAGPERVTVGLEDAEPAQLHNDDEVEAFAPQMPIRLVPAVASQAVPVPAAGELPWGLRATGADRSNRTGKGVKVAVLDTGIDVTHEAFAGLAFSAANVRNFTGGNKDDVTDDDGHGTHCAATIFGRTVKGVRVGVAPGVSDVLIAKVIGKNGGSFAALAEAIQWAYAQGAHVLSMSLGVDYDAHIQRLENRMPRAQARSQALADYGACVRLFDRLGAYVADASHTLRGMLIVAAAGNESSRPETLVSVPPPADASGVVSVAALGRGPEGGYAVAPFSNHGARFAAPGVEVISAKRGGGLESMNGTSMAAPHVAGLAALWAQDMIVNARPLRCDRLIRKLSDSADRLADLPRTDVGDGLPMAPQ